MRYLIVDDEPLSHEVIEAHAGNLPFMKKAGNCYDAIEALQFLAKESVDLMFLDIRMPKLEGFDFLRTLKNAPEVVAVSAHADYALEGYDLDICDYLLKPFNFERFLRAVNKARERLGEANGEAEAASDASASGAAERHESLFLKDGKKHHQVRFDDIQYVEACGNYCVVFTAKGQIIAGEKISELEKRLPQSFVRIHKSYMVATRKIQWVESEELGIADQRLPIGRVYKPNVTKLFK